MNYPDNPDSLSRADADAIGHGMPRFVTVNDSSVIYWIGYDPQAKIMVVGFAHSVWSYLNVWASDFGALVCAYSVGKVFNERIRNQFDAVRLSPERKEISRRVSSAGRAPHL